MHSTQKKQNKILLSALVVILAASAILIAVTGSANRKNPPENPPLDNKVGDESESESGESKPTIIPEKITPTTDPNEKTDEKETESSEKTDAPAENNADDKEVSSVLDKALPTFSAPVSGVVIKDYSDDVPVFSYTMNDYRVHSGLDFAASPGTPVYAAADGVVCEIKDDPMMGAVIALQHSGGAITKYKGLSKESLEMTKIGDTVRRGDVIGASGETALIESAEEAHVHFEMMIEGSPVDPAEYMKVSYLTDLYED